MPVCGHNSIEECSFLQYPWMIIAFWLFVLDSAGFSLQFRDAFPQHTSVMCIFTMEKASTVLPRTDCKALESIYYLSISSLACPKTIPSKTSSAPTPLKLQYDTERYEKPSSYMSVFQKSCTNNCEFTVHHSASRRALLDCEIPHLFAFTTVLL
jgi:hypothetical protein